MAVAASLKLEKPPSNGTAGLALQEFVVRPTVTSPSSAAADGPLITKVASLGAPLLGAALLTALYTRMATTTLSSPLCDSAEGAEPMCVLSGRQSTFVEEESLTRPRQAQDPLEEKIPRQGREPLARLRQAQEPLQAWRDWSLAKFLELVVSWALAGRPVVPWFPLCRQLA